MTSIAIIAFDGATDIDIFLHWDFLSRPVTMFGRESEDWQVRLLGTKDRHVTMAGLEVPMHGTIDEARDADAVVHASGPLTRTMMQDADYLSRLALNPNRQLVGSQCSGALILAASGLLTGLEATTYPTARTHLESFGTQFVARPFVAHERIATAAGCLAGVALDRWLLTKLLDATMAEQCIASGEAWGQGIESVYETEPS